eukprot:5164509-Amphidinium_carterae.2
MSHGEVFKMKRWSIYLVAETRAHYYGTANRELRAALPKFDETQQQLCQLVWSTPQVVVLHTRCGSLLGSRDSRMLHTRLLEELMPSPHLSKCLAKRYDFKHCGTAGVEKADGKTLRVLNRTITVNNDVVEYFHDSKHVPNALSNVGLEQCRPVVHNLQSTIALSHAKSETYGIVKGVAIGMGLQVLLSDWNLMTCVDVV